MLRLRRPTSNLRRYMLLRLRRPTATPTLITGPLIMDPFGLRRFRSALALDLAATTGMGAIMDMEVITDMEAIMGMGAGAEVTTAEVMAAIVEGCVGALPTWAWRRSRGG